MRKRFPSEREQKAVDRGPVELMSLAEFHFRKRPRVLLRLRKEYVRCACACIPRWNAVTGGKTEGSRDSAGRACMTFDALLERFQAKRVGANFMAKCPAHADRNPSLSISEKDGQILLRCHAGCDTRDVLGAIGLTFEDLHEGPKHEGPKLVATYDYVDENGEPLFQVCRFEPKTFKQRKRDDDVGWSWNLNGVRRVPFLLPDVLRADHVLVVEGEKDAQYAGQFMGLTATCNPGGAGKWKNEYSEFLRGKHVTIIPDNDEPGRRHASQVAQSLVGKAAPIAICDLPEGIKDLSEWPLSRESLIDLVKKAPAWSAESEDASLFQSRRDYEDAPPLQFAIDKFLQQDAVNAIAGLSGHGKTWLAPSIASALLFGPGKLWTLFNVKERAERVIYLIPESTIGPFKHRLERMGLYNEICSGRLLTRTLSKGPAPSLQDPRLLQAAKNAHIICDTGIRFMLNLKDENSASEAAKGLSEDFFALIRAGAKSVLALFHAPKSFSAQNSMSLESMIRGSSEFGAMLAAAWGIKQIDPATNTVHIENLKARDFDLCQPFELVGRPSIDETGDFQLFTQPGDCEELRLANVKRSDGRSDRVQIVAGWMKEDPEPTGPEMVERFAAMGVKVEANTVYRYRAQARKGATS